MAEFALVFPIFALLLFGIIDIGRYVFTANAINNGAREAVRLSSVINRPAECASLSREQCAIALARSHTWGVPPNSLVVTVTCERYIANAATPTYPPVASCVSDDILRVQASTNFTLVTPLISQFLGSLTIAGESRVAVNS